MYPLVEESQNRKEYGRHFRRLAPPRPIPPAREEGAESHAMRDDEDDLRIMQHFVRDLIERLQDT